MTNSNLQEISAQQLASVDLNDPQAVEGFMKQAMELGMSQPFAEGVLKELSLHQTKEAQLTKTSEEEYLGHLRSELRKMASELGEECPYTSEQIDEITKDAESFQKAASEEAHQVWDGLEQELRKQGADDAFIEGMRKEAYLMPLLRGIGTMGMEAFSNPAARQGFARAAKALTRSGAAAEIGLPSAKAFGQAASKGLATEGMTAANNITKGLRRQAMGKIFRDVGNTAGSTGLREAGLDMGEEAAKAVSRQSSHIAGKAESEYMRDLLSKQRENVLSGKPADPLLNQKIEAIKNKDFSMMEKDLGMKNPTNMSTTNAPQAMGGNSMGAREAYTSAAEEALVNPTAKAPNFSGHVPNASSGKPGGGAFRFQPSRFLPGAAKGAGWGTAIGGLFGGLPGMAVGGALGAGLGGTVGTLGVGGTTLAGTGLGAYGTYRVGKAMFGKDDSTDVYGNPNDRNRAVPFMKNNWSGGIGGALLGMLIANEMGMSGPMSWLLPVLGGVAGYNYFPQMMNKWKDPYGYGVNAIPYGAAQVNAGINPFPHQ